MIKINRYLEELGYTQEDLPGYYNSNLEDFSKAASDPRNKDMADYGFSNYEFFSLDHTFDLLIYPRLCYFKEFCNVGTPPGMTQQQWDKILDTMIEGFKINLTVKYPKIKQRKKIEKARMYFARYYNNLWF